MGWLAIEAARAWPALGVVGIDSWEPALGLARKNLAQSGVAERVELRLQRVEQLDDKTIFTLAWLPGPSIDAEIVAIALERIYRALMPGGWLIFGLHAPPRDTLGQALANLRIVCSRRRTSRPGAANIDLHFSRIISPFPNLIWKN